MYLKFFYQTICGIQVENSDEVIDVYTRSLGIIGVNINNQILTPHLRQYFKATSIFHNTNKYHPYL